MAIEIRKIADNIAYALPAVINALKEEAARGGFATPKPHKDITSRTRGDWKSLAQQTLSVEGGMPDGSLPKLLEISRQLVVYAKRHYGDVLAHKAADPAPTPAVPADLPGAIAALNALKAAHNAHAVDTTFHYVADTNLVTAPDATDQASADTLAADLMATQRAHFEASFTTPSIDVVAP